MMMIVVILVVLLTLYLLVGLYITIWGPARKGVNFVVGWARDMIKAGEWTLCGEVHVVSNAKMIWLAVRCVLRNVFLWPRTVSDLLDEKRRAEQYRLWKLESLKRPPEPRRPIDLRFSLMSGTGTLSCFACGHHQPLTSFIHGFRPPAWSVRGYQCRDCRQLVERMHKEGEDRHTRCECGGELGREDRITCPECGGDDLDYKCAVMA